MILITRIKHAFSMLTMTRNISCEFYGCALTICICEHWIFFSISLKVLTAEVEKEKNKWKLNWCLKKTRKKLQNWKTRFLYSTRTNYYCGVYFFFLWKILKIWANVPKKNEQKTWKMSKKCAKSELNIISKLKRMLKRKKLNFKKNSHKCLFSHKFKLFQLADIYWSQDYIRVNGSHYIMYSCSLNTSMLIIWYQVWTGFIISGISK